MKLKKIIVCLIGLFATISASDLSAQNAGASIDGSKYIGMASISGQPIDLWIEFNFSDATANMSMAGSYSFDGKYTVTSTGGTINVAIPFNEKIKANLKSADKGASMEGTLSLNGTPVKLWVVKIPSEHKPDEFSGEALDEVFSSPDGYTALVKIQQGDGLLCVPADFSADASSKHWEMKFDNKAMQDMFGTSQGSYSISGTDINLEDSAGMTTTGKSYDNGNYVEIPMGSAKGMTLTTILIR